LESVR